MLNNIAIPMFNDNYLWLLVSAQNTVIAVDVGDYALLQDFLQAHNLRLATVFITHRHYDHTAGLAQLRAEYPDVPIYGHDSIAHITHILQGGEIIYIKDFGRFLIIDTRGHTQFNLSYYHLQQKLLYCGDSLFSAGCGRIFEDGNAVNAYQALQKIALLPPNTQVCAAHEYTLDNLKFAQHIEPNNIDIAIYQKQCLALREQKIPTLPSILSTEQRVNPYLRCHLLMQRVAQLTQKTLNSPSDTFCALRAYKNSWTA
ncbi:MAG: hydroxyacylglutathione hydrolase [Moraxellaceae bacterium]|nr:hydroxyacylglutathione hydrolase [Moraxellaceae bacterium]